MTGVSYMIPFVAAGGLLIALSFLLGGYEIVGPYGDIAVNNTLFNLPDLRRARARPRAVQLGPAGLPRGAPLHHSARPPSRFLVPALAGYIAYAIADRPGIAPGFVLGGLATCQRAALDVVRHRLPRRASSAASWPASRPTGSRAGRCRPGRAA